MQVDFLSVLINVIILLALAIPGFILRKLKILNSSSIGALVAVLIYLCQPFLLVASLMTNSFESNMLSNLGIMAAFSIVLLILFFFLSKLLFIKSKQIETKGAYVYTSFFSNCGFIGIAIVSALFNANSTAVIYAVVFIIIFNILNWTLGIYLLSGDKSAISIRKAFLNPATISVIIGLPFYFTNAPVYMPNEITSTISVIGGMTTPISMIIMGIRLAEVKVKELFNGWNIYIVSGFKLIVCPLLTYVILLPFNIDMLIKAVLVLIMALPSAVSSIAFLEKLGKDSTAALKCVLVSTIFAAITIPLIMMLFTNAVF